MAATTKTKALVQTLCEMIVSRKTPYELRDDVVREILKRLHKRKGEPEKE